MISVPLRCSLRSRESGVDDLFHDEPGEARRVFQIKAWYVESDGMIRRDGKQLLRTRDQVRSQRLT